MSDRSELALRLWQSLVLELMERGVLDAGAVTRVLDGVDGANDVATLDEIRRHLTREASHLPGDRDREPNTPD